MSRMNFFRKKPKIKKKTGKEKMPSILYLEIQDQILEEFKDLLMTLKESDEMKNIKKQKHIPNRKKINLNILEEDDIEIINYLKNKVLSERFFKEYTSFKNLDDFISRYPLQISYEDRELLDNFIVNNSEFDDWEQFLGVAFFLSFN